MGATGLNELDGLLTNCLSLPSTNLASPNLSPNSCYCPNSPNHDDDDDDGGGDGIVALSYDDPVEGEGNAEELLPPGLLPVHKASILLFLERVYGIPNQETFFSLVEDGFLPDLRAATTLDTVS